ncbi:energy-coupling factor transport system substrate-specific component [Lachnospiraceae bacterium PF1-21]|uniref:ECF-type riboflavin transporter substrate-binding protein n=1 Tax=Ohessyouella blattaphilus TaxID=2949333 RepID=UPI003E1F4074
MKKLFEFKTRTIVATGLGAALFMLLFMYIKIPTGIQETDIKTAYGIGAFFAALFGPIAGGLIGFIGHALSDAILYGSPWWSWVIASGITCFGVGFVYPKLRIEEGIFGMSDIIRFNVVQIISNLVAWVVVAPVLDIVIYAEPANLVFLQGVVAFISNSISAGVIGTILLVIYSKTKSQKGSLSKEG